jgi:ATP-binding cassette subfamily B protein
LYQQFTHLAQDKTVVLVTHRLASVQMADQILVLQRGRLIEQGSHPELMRQMGEYAKLYRMQAEQYKLEGVMQIDS